MYASSAPLDPFLRGSMFLDFHGINAPYHSVIIIGKNVELALRNGGNSEYV